MGLSRPRAYGRFLLVVAWPGGVRAARDQTRRSSGRPAVPKLRSPRTIVAPARAAAVPPAVPEASLAAPPSPRSPLRSDPWPHYPDLAPRRPPAPADQE